MAEFFVTMQFSMAAGDIAHIEKTANEMRCSVSDRVSDLVATAIQMESSREAVPGRFTVESNGLVPYDGGFIEPDGQP